MAFTIGWSRVLIWNDNLSFFYKEDRDRSVINTGAYYANAVGWGAADGVAYGKSDTVFAPDDNVTRGEAAAFIARADGNRA
ncbi:MULTISPECIES: S-layer homology domain-containing protein [unclassified Bilifractor]|uniref:S-layer homology domain-containing protein n=1 Tax=unclassified Bilifractor TaxID=2815795 RepID=UPI003F931532